MATTLHRRHPNSSVKAGTVIAALDIGSTKIACLIGRADPMVPEGFAYLGGGRQQSRGFDCGRITDIEALERSIRLAVKMPKEKPVNGSNALFWASPARISTLST